MDKEFEKRAAELAKKVTQEQYQKLLDILDKQFGKIADRFDRIDEHLGISSEKDPDPESEED